MTPTDRKAFLEIVVGFAELKGKQLSAPAMELYWRSMQHWTLQEFRDAAQHLLRSCEFMPTPKDFEDLRKAGRDTAGEAWTRAISHAGSGQYRRGGTGDAVLDKAVRCLGGYEAIAMCDVEKLHFLERRFCEHYETMRDSNDVREAIPAIAHARQAITGPEKASDAAGRLLLSRN